MARREEITVWSWEHTAIVLLTLIAITSICIVICMYGGHFFLIHRLGLYPASTFNRAYYGRFLCASASQGRRVVIVILFGETARLAAYIGFIHFHYASQ